MNFLTHVGHTILLIALLTAYTHAADAWVVYEGSEGPGKGKQIVLISGDEEYRSEEGLPQLGKILARHHGFTCTVLFAVDPKSGEIDPAHTQNIPGLEALRSADLLILLTRFRNLPDEQMQSIADYVESGKPIIGLRTATHAFKFPHKNKFAKYSWDAKDGGFGKQVLGETWVKHHGGHGKQSTRGIIAQGQESNPILTGIKSGDIWGPSDVYAVNLPLAGDSQPLLLGQVLSGMKPDDSPVEGEPNEPMMPIAWTRHYTGDQGKAARVFTTTMGAATDLSNEALRRLIVNAAYWCVGMEDRIPAKSNVEIVGEFNPTPFGFGAFKKGVKPADHAIK
jgi:type 1 glutamine amidotransferase